MKTPIQELIEWLGKRIEDCNELGGLEIAKWAFIQAKKKATELLEKEREQNLGQIGMIEVVAKEFTIPKPDLDDKTDAETYYNETFNQNK